MRTPVTDGEQAAGYKQVQWSASDFTSGVYFYRLDAGGIHDPHSENLLFFAIGVGHPLGNVQTLRVYFILGQEVPESIHDEVMDEAEKAVKFDGSNPPSGVYYFSMIARDVATNQTIFANSYGVNSIN